MDGRDSSEEDLEQQQEQEVMSEVHIGCPPFSSGPHISRFTIFLPPEVEPSRYDELFKAEAASVRKVITLDEDGDLVLPRRSKQSTRCFSVTIQHNITSSIPNVGLQVWKAELLLSDFVMHKMCTTSEFNEIISLELGAGTGTSRQLIILEKVVQIALLGKIFVFISRQNYGDDILDNCAKNIHLNSGVFSHQGSIHVCELNWMNPWPPKVCLGNSSAPQERYPWNSSELEEVQSASVLLAADVIYSDNLTDAFFRTLNRLMLIGSEKVLYLSLEKRYNFSLDDLDVVANGYSHFRSYIWVEGECDKLECTSLPIFEGKCIDLNGIPQYVREYDRGNDVELWQIKLKKGTS